MIDWTVIAKIWSGYGVNIIILIILLIIAWVIGFAVQKLHFKGKEDSKKG